LKFKCNPFLYAMVHGGRGAESHRDNLCGPLNSPWLSVA
jgi:hypothetical protein